MHIELAGNTIVRYTNFEYTGETALEVVDADDTVEARRQLVGLRGRAR